MEIKKIVNGMTAVEVSKIIEDGFRQLNAEKAEKAETNVKISELGKDIDIVKKATIKNKGFFLSVESLKEAYPSASLGDIAYIGISSPYDVWIWDGNNWVFSTQKEGGLNVPLNDYYSKLDLDKKNESIQIYLNEYVEQDCSLGTKGWYIDGSVGRHKAIPVNGMKFISISVGNEPTYIGFVTSAYNPPYKTDDPIPFCPSTNNRIIQDAETSVQYSIPSDCAYVILTTVDGGGKTIEYDFVELYNSTPCPERLNDIEKSIKDLSFKRENFFNVDLSGFVEQDCSLGTKGWYIEGSAGRHKAIPVNGMRLLRISTGVSKTYIGFVTSAYNPPYRIDDPIPYCLTSPARITQLGNAVKEYSIPSDCAYVILTTVDGGGLTVEYVLVEVGEESELNIPEYIDDTEKRLEKIEFTLKSEGGEFFDVDLSGIVEQDCSLGSSGWYINGSAGRHKAIPVNGMRLLRISTGVSKAYIGFVTSAYNPPYKIDDPIPYCLTSPARITQLGNAVKEYSIPSDCAYVILTTVDGGGLTVEYKDIVLSENISIAEKLKDLQIAVENGMDGNSNGISRIKVMSWNVGHYCNGTGVNTSITNENYIQKRYEYRELLNRCAADFLGLVEYSDVFNESTGESSESAIISQYKHRLFGGITVGGYVCNGLASVVKPVLKGFINFELEYYAMDFEVEYMGSKFRLCIAHLPWQSENYNLNAINTLITYYATTQKVIIVGDFNVREDYYYDMFSGAGYELANHGYMGDIVTYPNESNSHILDNILVKGGQILSVEVVKSDLSDHYPIISEIVI